MSWSTGRTLVVLTGDALREALRRRLALGLAILAVLGVAIAERCTSLPAGSWIVNGVVIESAAVASWLAPIVYASETLACVLLAGVLAAEHLARPVSEGAAELWLARPVGRASYAVARLLGVLGVAGALAAVLLGATAALLVLRHGLDLRPALACALAGALGALVVGALAMCASLVLGRVVVIALVLALVPLAAASELLVASGAELGGWIGAIGRHGPPLGSALLRSVAPWNPHLAAVTGAGAPVSSALFGLALWGVAAVALLAVAFRRVEIGG